jgi:hypothetical protein
MNPTESNQTEEIKTETDHCCDHRGYGYGYGHRRHKLLAIGLALLAIALGGLLFTRLAFGHMEARFGGARTTINREVGGGGRGMMGGGMMGQRRAGFGGGERQTALIGVVTAVDGSKLTVAGNGATVVVQTDSNTSYVGAGSAKVNDTVRVIGTQSNGVWTATSIRVN